MGNAIIRRHRCLFRSRIGGQTSEQTSEQISGQISDRIMGQIARRFLICVMIPLGLVSCAKRDLSLEERTPVSPRFTQHPLVASDVEKFSELSQSSVINYDRNSKGLFSSLFGGTSGADVRRYFDERIRYYFQPGDSSRMIGYSTSLNEMQDADHKPESVTLAFNVGTELWLTGAALGERRSLLYNGRLIPIDSTRVGIMEVGAGYTIPYLNVPVGGKLKRVPVPSSVRQATLVHEARHSDCTGGITKRDLQIWKFNASKPNLLNLLESKTCGHMHLECPAWHGFAGLLACDSEPFGSYAIGAIFIAALVDQSTSDDERALLEMKRADSFSRLLYSPRALLEGAFGRPDMSSGGIKEN